MNPLSLDFNQTLRILTLAQGSVLVEGHMGSGKSSLLQPVAEARGSKPIYLDCSSLDLGDLFLPDLNNKDDKACIRFIPNEALGLHTGSHYSQCHGNSTCIGCLGEKTHEKSLD